MKRFLIALLLAAGASPLATATVATINYSDLWWNPGEPGWGVTIDQQQTTLFLTFYLYGSDGQPTWAVAQLERTGTAPGGQPVFSGPLSTTSGAWFGGPSGPMTVHTAGTATFAPDDAVSGRLDYSIDGVAVSRQVRRQTLANDNLSGNYTIVAEVTAACDGMAPESGVIASATTITLTGSQFQYREYDPDNPADACTWTGAWIQEGQFARVSGGMTCTGGNTGTFSFTQISSSGSGFLARMTVSAQAPEGYRCTLSGPVAGFRH